MACIYTLRDQNDQWVEGFEEVAEVITKFYRELLVKKEYHRTKIDHQVLNQGKYLSIEQQIQLCHPSTDNDIKQALFSIPNHKSPGPDGFTSGFYEEAWDWIGNLVRSAVKSSF